MPDNEQKSAVTGRAPSRRVTSVDVATEAGFSQATVARVFTSPQKVSPGTRAKIEAAAERLGYVPDAIARSLKSQRTNIIGAVVPGLGEYWQNVLTSFSQQLAQCGRQLLLFSFNEPEHLEPALAAVEQYRLDGLVMASATFAPQQLSRMAARNMPVVAFNQPAASGIVPSVSVDNEAGTQALAQHVVDAGATDAVFIGGLASASTDRLRYRGAVTALGEHDIACPYIEAGGFTYAAGYRAAAELLASRALPSTILVGSDEVAFGVIDGLRNAGVGIPEDVMVTGFDGLPQSLWAGYDLTTLVQDTGLLVERAVELLLQPSGVVGGSTTPNDPRSVVVSGTVRVGATTNKPRSTSG